MIKMIQNGKELVSPVEEFSELFTYRAFATE